MVSTAFGADDPARVQRLLVPLLRPFMKSPTQGAATSIHLASAPELERVTGGYFANSKPKRATKHSYDEAVAARLWRVSSQPGRAQPARGRRTSPTATSCSPGDGSAS